MEGRILVSLRSSCGHTLHIEWNFNCLLSYENLRKKAHTFLETNIFSLCEVGTYP